MTHTRVVCPRIVFRPQLQRALDSLPDDSARKCVLFALTDPNNELFEHQSLLLTCLAERGLPKGMSSDEWWSAHDWYFSPVLNEEELAARCAGIAFMAQCGHPSDQLGVDARDLLAKEEQLFSSNALVRAYVNISDDARNPKTRQEYAMYRIVWWTSQDHCSGVMH